MTRCRRVFPALPALLAGAVLLSACSEDRPPAAGEPAPSTPSIPSASASTDPDLAALEQLPVLATVDGTGKAAGLRAEVLAVQRTAAGPAVVRYRVTRLEQDASLIALDSVEYKGVDAASVRLLDERNLVAGVPLADADGQCLCSQWPAKGRKEQVALFAAFPAPAPDAAIALQLEDFPTTPLLEVTDADASTDRLSGEPDEAALRAATARTRQLLLRSAAVDDSRRTSRDGDSVTVDVSSDVLFAFGEATPTPQAQARLQEVASELRQSAEGTVQVVGHTDSVGDNASNQRLSERRAAAVRDLLQQQTAGSGLQFAASGRGEQEPVAEERGPDREQAAALNRRVTVSYSLAQQAPPPPPSPAVGGPAPAASPGAVLRSATSATSPAELEVLSLQRTGLGLVAGTFRLTNTGSTLITLNTYLSERPTSGKSLPVVDSLQLIDRAGATAYKVVIDDAPRPLCLCTRLQPLAPGASQMLAATFAAPPPGVTAVDVTAFGFGPPAAGVRLS